MVRSMTGYGKAETVFGQKKITVETRSLNSKQLDLSLRTPSAYRTYESELRSRASKALSRGKADIFVTVENMSGAANARINAGTFASYYKQLAGMTSENSISWGSELSDATILPAILRLPEVIESATDEIPEEEAAILFETLEKALCSMDEFRLREGQTLISDILSRVTNIGSLLGLVEPYESRRVEAVKARLTEHLDSLNAEIDKNRLEQELIYYIEKFDVTEEKVRLGNHCAYFREVVEKEDNPGRKLGFIAQEMGREINTLGSKANDSEIQHIVVDMKDELEKIKEQLLNIL